MEKISVVSGNHPRLKLIFAVILLLFTLPAAGSKRGRSSTTYPRASGAHAATVLDHIRSEQADHRQQQ
jgi:hypothetical protein